MDNSRHVVYYEDLNSSSKADENAPVGALDASQPGASQPDTESDTPAKDNAATSEVAKPTAKPAQTTGGVKRQRTLMDMFSGNSTANPSEPATKKLRAGGSSGSLSHSGSPATAKSSVTVFGLQPLNSIPYSPSALIASLTDDQKRLLRLEIETMGKSWLKLLKDEIKKPYFIALKDFLWKEGVHGPDDSAKGLKVYPAPKDIYSWSNLTPLGKVKVVIIGQDPYHGPGQAHGLSFSVPPGVAIPPSLRNIYAEIKAEYPTFNPPKHGHVLLHAKSKFGGIYMFADTAGSHQGKGWETFTDRVVDVIDRYGGANLGDRTGLGRGVVFLAWGSWAQKRVAKLDKKKHLILHSAHPSPLSAHRGFMGNGHFKAANDWLEQRYGAGGQVDWCNLTVKPPSEDA